MMPTCLKFCMESNNTYKSMNNHGLTWVISFSTSCALLSSWPHNLAINWDDLRPLKYFQKLAIKIRVCMHMFISWIWQAWESDSYFNAGLCRQQLVFLAVRAILIGWMCCLWWWQMLETVTVLPFQVKTAHLLLLLSFVVSIWYVQ